MHAFVLLILSWLSSTANATVDPKCADVPQPDNYDEQVQGDFLANYYALNSTFSPLHAPVPHQPGHGAIGVDVSVMPPLKCEKRYVLNWTKTEETNKSPVLPRITASFAFPAIGRIFVPYVGVGYLPPVPINGTRNVVLSAELGGGFLITDMLQAGLRGHATLHRTIGDVAGAFTEDEPAVDDVYLASTFGIDAMFGVALPILTPYVAVGFTDVSDFFWIGDDSYVGNNLHPYFGPNFSVGVDGLVKDRFRFGAEFYGAPGGYSRPDKTVESVTEFGRYGHLYTARIRLAVEI